MVNKSFLGGRQTGIYNNPVEEGFSEAPVWSLLGVSR